MKTLIAIMAGVAFVAFAWFMLPGPPRPEPTQAAGGHAGHAADPAVRAEGVVVSVDRTAKTVTIRHGPLLNLGMPSMTMGFEVGDLAVLDKLKPGDKVTFHADVIGPAFTASAIEIAN